MSNQFMNVCPGRTQLADGKRLFCQCPTSRNGLRDRESTSQTNVHSLATTHGTYKNAFPLSCERHIGIQNESKHFL